MSSGCVYSLTCISCLIKLLCRWGLAQWCLEGMLHQWPLKADLHKCTLRRVRGRWARSERVRRRAMVIDRSEKLSAKSAVGKLSWTIRDKDSNQTVYNKRRRNKPLKGFSTFFFLKQKIYILIHKTIFKTIIHFPPIIAF